MCESVPREDVKTKLVPEIRERDGNNALPSLFGIPTAPSGFRKRVVRSEQPINDCRLIIVDFRSEGSG